MKAIKKHGMLTALWATSALAWGGSALNHNNETIKAKTTANVYEQLGNYAVAEQYNGIASDKRDDRNFNLVLLAGDIALVGLSGANWLEARDEERKKEQQEA